MKTALRNAFFLLLAAVSFLPQSVFAAGEQCAAQGGTCGLAGLESESVGPLDCTPPRKCYVPQQQQQSGGGANCAAAGGFCAYPTLYERSGILLEANDCSPDTYACFKNGTPQTPPTPVSGSSNSGASQVNTPDRLILPPCTKTGDCTLDDIVATGVNFATFLMGLSGALFFAVFIYGGAMYLISFGDAKRVEKGKTAIKGAVIGMVFVLAAWTIVNALTKGLTGSSTPGGADQCTAQGAGFSCVTLTGNTSQAAMSDGESKGYSCRTGLCPLPVNVLCCKLK